MSLSSALSIISSSLTANAAQTAVVSRNIANANTPGYSREIANVITNSYGGADVVAITRQANAALLEQSTEATSGAAYQDAISTSIGTLAQSVNDSASSSASSGLFQNGASPSAMIGNLASALTSFAANPSDPAAGQGVVTAAQGVVDALHAGAAAVQSVREQADGAMAQSVKTINALLAKFTDANNAVVTGLKSGADVTAAADARDHIVTQLAQQLGVTTTTGGDGSMSIYTDSGLTLFQASPRQVSFVASGSLPAGAVGNVVTVDGVAVTGSSAPMKIQSGALAGYAAVRDQIAPEYQSQLDQIANGLVAAFAESDQSATPTLPTVPGLFTAAGLSGVPAPTASTGLAAALQINANVDPSQGGSVSLLRDGGVSNPSNPAYTYNTGGGAGFTGRIRQLAANLAAPTSFDPSAGLGSTMSVVDYASASVGWIQGQHQQATDKASYSAALASQASAALSNGTGVNLDTEMTNMLSLENSYATTAKLLTTVGTMFQALLDAA